MALAPGSRASLHSPCPADGHACNSCAKLAWRGAAWRGMACPTLLRMAWHGKDMAGQCQHHAMPCHAMPLLGSVLLRTAASPVACAAGLAALPRGRNAAHLGGDERQLQCTGVHGQVRRMALLAAELLPAIAAASPLPMVLPIAAHQLLRLALLLPGCRLGRRACTTLSGPSAFTSNCGWHGMGWGGVSQSHCREPLPAMMQLHLSTCIGMPWTECISRSRLERPSPCHHELP